mgnify:CR=1 FL=1
MKARLRYLLICFCLLMTSLGAAYAAETADYTWSRAYVGGGGFITGIAIHPKEADLMYARCDVGGLFRWIPEKNEWKQLLESISYADRNFCGVDGMALDPNNPDVIYIAAGKDTNYTLDCDVLKSTDRGETWTRTRLTDLFTGPGIQFHGNGALRYMGECIAVDPANSDIVYVGTRNEGLFKSTDGAATWSKVSGVPAGEEVAKKDAPNVSTNNLPIGTRTVVFDPTSAENGVSQVIYASVFGKGIYRSKDAGETWELIDGSPTLTAKAEFGSDGTLYITTMGQGVRKYYNDKWMDITPRDKNTRYCGLSVDPNNPNNIIVSTYESSDNLPMYRSRDKGVSWEKITMNAEKNRKYAPSWYPKWYFMASTSQVIFDPHHPGQAYAADWYSVWRTPDVWKEPSDGTEWYAQLKGLETTCTLALATPPKGTQLFSAGADYGGQRHSDLGGIPETKLIQMMGNINGVDYSEANPNYMVVTGSKFHDGSGVFAVSSDNGETFTQIATAADTRNGRVAYSATDINKIVWVPQNHAPIVSNDRGKTWTETNGAPSDAVPEFWRTFHPLAADKVNGNTFYLLCPKEGEGSPSYFYRSTDGGLNWNLVNTTDLPDSLQWYYPQVKAAPGMEGEVWTAQGRNGLYRSGNGGDTFTKVENVQTARLVAFGKNPPGKSHPAVFVQGTVNDITDGVFRSDDMGKTWIRVNNDAVKIGDVPVAMEGDRQVFGQVFIGTNGMGVFRGYPSDTALPEEISVVIDGKTLEFSEQKPEIINDRTLVPMRDIFEALGARVDWDASAQKVTAVKGDTTVVLTIGSATAMKGEETITLDTPAVISNGRTMVPLRFVGEALGAKVQWIGGTRSVNIITENLTTE